MWKRLADLLRNVAERDDISITVITGTGKFFSSGADVKNRPPGGNASGEENPRRTIMSTMVHINFDMARAFSEHPKILIAALNGPAIGMSAAMIAHCDFIYAVENAYLLTPFTSLALVAEGGSSYTFVQRMGIAKANDALLLSKKLSAQDLLAQGFFNKLFPQQPDSTFHASVLTYIHERFGPLYKESLLQTKKLIRDATRRDVERAITNEFLGAIERFVNTRCFVFAY